MTTLAQKRQPPPPLTLHHLLAVVLELLMLASFVQGRSVAGIILWVAYLWFSATWAAFARLWSGD